MAVEANTKNPQVAQVTANILKCISGGRVLSLKDIYGNGPCLNVLWIMQRLFLSKIDELKKCSIFINEKFLKDFNFKKDGQRYRNACRQNMTNKRKDWRRKNYEEAKSYNTEDFQ